MNIIKNKKKTCHHHHKKIKSIIYFVGLWSELKKNTKNQQQDPIYNNLLLFKYLVSHI